MHCKTTRSRIGSLLKCGTLLILLVISPACRRDFYRWQADRDADVLLVEKSSARPWAVDPGFSVDPDPRSRFHIEGCPENPDLPMAGPRLHEFRLEDQLPPDDNDTVPKKAELGPPEMSPQTPPAPDPGQPLPAPDGYGSEADEVWQTLFVSSEQNEQPTPPKQGEQPGSEDIASLLSLDADAEEGLVGLPIQPIPRSYFEALPIACRTRMFEFETIRTEYERQYKKQPTERDRSRKLTLDNIVQLALIHSREYQSEKERLYRTALTLSLQRFDYSTKFSTSGNGTDANFTQTRNGTLVNTLAIPSTFQADRMLATGGNLLARFANNVVLTFNGASGFASDVSSDLLFSLTQSVLQRDIQLETLVQSERNVVYAARDFTRFRKTFYFGLAQQYYQLLLTYRSIEINAQNYFSVIRSFEQSTTESRFGTQRAPNRIQVDQLEQQTLSIRRSLISSCNALENALDRLKLSIGLPTETAINLNLQELAQLTLRDQLEVAGEQVVRWHKRARDSRNRQVPDRGDLLNADIFLIERTIEWLRLRTRLGQTTANVARLRELLVTLRVDEARMQADEDEALLKETLSAKIENVEFTGPARPLILRFQSRVRTAQSYLLLIRRQIALAEYLKKDAMKIEAFKKARKAAEEQLRKLSTDVIRALRNLKEGDIESFDTRGNKLFTETQALSRQLDALIGRRAAGTDEKADTQRILKITDELIALVNGLITSRAPALVPVRISVDDAMHMALLRRLDLMNQRGTLADSWRAIKLAGDDLRSILNLNASHNIGTAANLNRPFDFRAENSTTSLRLSFDLPLNRKSQRNSYRNALISYNATLRSLINTEDNTKFAVRSDLRTLELAQAQYPISVSQAALAAEQVVSTQLSLALGVGAIALDVLQALDSARNAVTDVAAQRISYIISRARLALDLELMLLDERGSWPELRNDNFRSRQDENWQYMLDPAYGRLPRVFVSRHMRKLEKVPYASGPTWDRETVQPGNQRPADQQLPRPAQEQR